MSMIRHCKIRHQKVIIAPERLQRPKHFHPTTVEENLDLCPFEMGSEALTPHELFRLEDSEGAWLCRVVPNRYKALSIEEEKTSQRIGFFTQEAGLGAHEVIVETPQHQLRMGSYTLETWQAYLGAVISRILDLRRDTRLAYIQVFKNQGLQAGASLSHPHSQILATAFIPPMIEKEIEIQRAYFKVEKRSLILDILREELREKKRVVCENAHFVAFTPFASLYAFEVHIVPKVQHSNISDLSQEEVHSLAYILQDVHQRMESVLGDFDFNMIFKNAPLEVEHPQADYFHQMAQFFTFHIQLLPRLYTLAGYEVSTGMFINPIVPEMAAEKLKEVHI